MSNQKQDVENAIKAGQTADLLCQDLQTLAISENKLLSSFAMIYLEKAAELKTHLARVSSDLQ